MRPAQHSRRRRRRRLQPFVRAHDARRTRVSFTTGSSYWRSISTTTPPNERAGLVRPETRFSRTSRTDLTGGRDRQTGSVGFSEPCSSQYCRTQRRGVKGLIESLRRRMSAPRRSYGTSERFRTATTATWNSSAMRKPATRDHSKSRGATSAIVYYQHGFDNDVAAAAQLSARARSPGCEHSA